MSIVCEFLLRHHQRNYYIECYLNIINTKTMIILDVI